jgi:regulatory protein
LETALRFLGQRARSEAEITDCLIRKGCSPALAKTTVEKLRASRYASDESFARDWARSRVDGRGYGPLRIAQELRAKGIDESLILDTLREIFAGGHEMESARQLLEKRFGRRKLDDPRMLRRAAAFLQRRGYSETVITSVLRLHED